MKIYTKTGDRGETGLFGGGRVSKSDLRIEVYGTVDELNSVIGVCRSLAPAPQVDAVLERVQHMLFALGADLATPAGSTANPQAIVRLDSSSVAFLETAIDAAASALPPLTEFVLPGGSQCGAMIHLARTVCRRAERLVVRLAENEPAGELPVIYLNRLSDALFMLARLENSLKGASEPKWKK